MEMQVRQEGPVHIIACQGRMDANVSGSLKERIQQLVEKGARRLIVDLEGVDFLESGMEMWVRPPGKAPWLPYWRRWSAAS